MKQAFRSGLEKNLSEKLDGQYLFEPYGLPYTTHRKYLPDFVHEDMAYTFEGYREAFLRDSDEVLILETLNITSEDLLNAFEDRLIRHREEEVEDEH